MQNGIQAIATLHELPQISLQPEEDLDAAFAQYLVFCAKN